QTGCGRDSLGEVDRAAAADRQQPVGVPRSRGNLVDPVARHLAPASRRGQIEVRPALARDQERPLDSELAQEVGQLPQAPADDHAATSAEAHTIAGLQLGFSGRAAEQAAAPAKPAWPSSGLASDALAAQPL